MKINWTKESVFSEPDVEFGKEYLKHSEQYLNDRLKLHGFLFLNEALDSLGIKLIKRGQLDGWIWDEIDPNGQIPVKFRIRVVDGDLTLNLNEEKNIIDNVFEK